MEEKQVVADEVCEKEFIEWCEANGIDYDVSNMNEESAEAFNKNKSTLHMQFQLLSYFLLTIQSN